ncbi:hypothetical protein BV898_10035 [Hypsibius exemplaris]|uniref:Uncharacterized protein n=1 Tax=Hypsibius exemplaris TaxID=2072580 RepID=A0A1W0WKT3_HYPEX|nr:hypothetical protein BV898_10035 [Hypsibius exemplaris]
MVLEMDSLRRFTFGYRRCDMFYCSFTLTVKDARALERRFLASPQDIADVTKNAKEFIKKLLIDIGTTVEELKDKAFGKDPKGKGGKNDQPAPKSASQ